MRSSTVAKLFALLTILVAVACSGGGNSTPPKVNPTPLPTATPSPPPTATPVPTATPLALALNPTSLSFTTAGTTQSFAPSESGYTGAFNAASSGATSCTGIATFTPASTTGPSASFSVTSVAAGQCTITISDSHGGVVSETVVVTTTSGTINVRPR